MDKGFMRWHLLVGFAALAGSTLSVGTTSSLEADPVV